MIYKLMEIYILIGVFVVLFIYLVYSTQNNSSSNTNIENMINLRVRNNMFENDDMISKTMEEHHLNKFRKTDLMNKHLIYTKPLGTSNFNNHDIYHIINIHDTNDLRFNDTHCSIMISWLLNHGKVSSNNRRVFKYFDIHDKYYKMPLSSEDYEKVLLLDQKCEKLKRYDQDENMNGDINEMDIRVRRDFIFNHSDDKKDITNKYEYYMIVVCGNTKDDVFITNQYHSMDDRCQVKLVGLADLMIKECNSEIRYMRMEDVIKRNNINFYQLFRIEMIEKDGDVYVDKVESRPEYDISCEGIDKLFLHLFENFDC